MNGLGSGFEAGTAVQNNQKSILLREEASNSVILTIATLCCDHAENP